MPNDKIKEINEKSQKIEIFSNIVKYLPFIAYLLMIIVYTLFLTDFFNNLYAASIIIIMVILMVVYFNKLSNKSHIELRKSRDILQQEQLKIQEKIAKQVSEFTEIPEESLNDYLLASYTLSSQVTEGELKKMVEERFNSIILPRIEGIEKRFPAESKLDKIASVNDAILATNIENLSDSIKKIEDKMLTKWDIVKITFEILLVLGGIIGLILTIITNNT